MPSVTTVLSVLAKPALTTWMVEQGILAALTLPRMDDEAEADFIARIREDGKAQAKAAAEEGTRIHDALECAFKGEWFPHVYTPHVDAVREELTHLFPEVTDWIAEARLASAERSAISNGSASMRNSTWPLRTARLSVTETCCTWPPTSGAIWTRKVSTAACEVYGVTRSAITS